MKNQSIDLTGNQVKEMYEFMGGDFTASVTVKHLEEHLVYPALDEMAPAGLYVYCSDYPEEGSMYLSPEPLLTIERNKTESNTKVVNGQILPSRYQLGTMLRTRRDSEAFPVTAICFREGKVNYELNNGFYSSENVLPALQVV